MNEVEKMYKLVNVAKPVIKKWYYDGYYEDFSWESSEEDCTKLLKYFDNSVDKLNDKIQQMKKEENTGYDRYTDSVVTEFGRIEKAYIDYPPFTVKKQLELYKYLCKPFLITTRYYFDEFSITAENTFEWKTMTKVSATGKTYEECIAKLVNNLWQDLTEEERKQIKNILE